ncbi:PepSY domain-containing protein [Rhodovarius crocodyli]|uniref:PepSY domain-containing protein n=1 Tax=Rhodovarius crocodyli TaxID=1979269 RepID=A0A437MDR8_9PROT|nr:PepSY domain-containing protein [Rhodovarius crocodyli]RVT95792.1 PepSY domain-containing protein [Rhodovarius crocodyli]
MRSIIATAALAAVLIAPAAMAQPAPGSSGSSMPQRSAEPPPTTTAPAAGANSFTEGQARSRIEAAGFTNVTELMRDDAGVWRGRAMRAGQTLDVGLDFQGNVVVGGGPARR